MFTQDEMRFLRDCSENEIMDEIIHKMTLVNSNGRPIPKENKMTDEKVELFEAIMSNKKLSLQQVVLVTDIFNTPGYVKPQILVTINGGAFQFAHANMDIELVIEDQDNIRDGDDLYYPCLAGDTQEEFDKQTQKAYEQVLRAKARNLKHEPVTEARVFIHDPEDEFPFNVQVNGEILATYKTFPEAYSFMSDYLEERNYGTGSN